MNVNNLSFTLFKNNHFFSFFFFFYSLLTRVIPIVLISNLTEGKASDFFKISKREGWASKILILRKDALLKWSSAFSEGGWYISWFFFCHFLERKYCRFLLSIFTNVYLVCMGTYKENLNRGELRLAGGKLPKIATRCGCLNT